MYTTAPMTAAMLREATTTFDGAQAMVFTGQMLGVLNGTAHTLMASIGHRTGLLDRLAATSPCTARELAT